MTRKDYIKIGKVIAGQYNLNDDGTIQEDETCITLNRLMTGLGAMFIDDNPLFNKNKFEEFVIAQAQKLSE